jgi:hypothetical protein
MKVEGFGAVGGEGGGGGVVRCWVSWRCGFI